VSRQLKPHWAAPQGADADQLVTIVRFRLARNGALVGAPEVIGQSGVTPSNAPQKDRHAEQAIRAIRLAAPFDLPEEYYSAWQTVTSRFDRRLSE
jgi:periplasmic protein TonB